MDPKKHAPQQEESPARHKRASTVSEGALSPLQPSELASVHRMGLGATPLTPGAVTRLQRTIGNQAVGRMLQDTRQRPGLALRRTPIALVPGSGPEVVQRRGENPYGQPGAHGGWDLTAHHIIAHSTLTGALEKLKELAPDKRKEILKYAVPETITDTMLANLKVTPPDNVDLETFKKDLRAKLAGDADDNETVQAIRLGDMRESFFEWQGGNQFQGPNTSIRAEPSSSKDDIDFDGQFFSDLPKEQFAQLTGHGADLKNLNKGDDVEAIAEKLKQILTITRNITPRPFDADGWTDVGSLAELVELSKTMKLSRDHILGYSFFKLNQSDIGPGQKYDKIAAASGGEFQYEGLKIPLQVKGTLGYVALNASEKVTPTTTATKPLRDILTTLGVEITDVDKQVELTKYDNKIELDKGKRFKVAGYADTLIPYMSEGGGKINVAAGMFNNKKMITQTKGTSLYNYFEALGTPTSSYLPKTLYEKLKEPQKDESMGEVPVQSEPVVKAPFKSNLNPKAKPFFPRGVLNPYAEPFYPRGMKPTDK